MSSRITRPSVEPAHQCYPELVRESARRYMTDLQQKRAEMTPTARAAADQLIATLDVALDRETGLTPPDLVFGSRSLDGISESDRPLFVNEFSLGVGFDAAPIIVMGTEAAEDYSGNNEDLAFHCLYVVLQLAGGQQAILQRIAEGSEWGKTVDDWTSPRRRYDFEPNDLLNLNMGRPRTWRLVAEVAAGSLDPVDWRPLVDPAGASPGLGAYTYQIERSAHAALIASKGTPPSDTRVEFLIEHGMPKLRGSSATLILHGFGGGNWKEWSRQDGRLIQAFLGAKEPPTFTWQQKVARQSIEFAEHDGRRVIYSRALNGAVARRYKQAVIDLVHQPTVTWPPALD